MGGAIGSVVIGAVLFALAGGGDIGLTTLLSTAGETGNPALQHLVPAERAALAGHLGSAFEAVFGTLAAIAAAGAALAASIPRKRI